MNNKNDVQRQIPMTNQKPQHPSLPPKPTFDRFNKENYYNPFNAPNNENSRPSIHQTSNTPTNLTSDGEHVKSTGMQYVKHSQQLHPFQVFMDLKSSIFPDKIPLDHDNPLLYIIIFTENSNDGT